MLNRIKSFCKSQGMTEQEITILLNNLNEIDNGIQRFIDDINNRNALRRVRNYNQLHKPKKL